MWFQKNYINSMAQALCLILTRPVRQERLTTLSMNRRNIMILIAHWRKMQQLLAIQFERDFKLIAH